MRRTARYVAIAALGVIALMSAASCPAALLSYSPGIPLIPAPRAYQAPVIDGNLDDACWAKAGHSSNFTTVTGKGLAKDQTKIYLAYDKEKLYVAFYCAGPQPAKLVTAVGERDGSVWRDDSVELFLDPGRSREHYFHLIANAAGIQYDAEMGAGKLGAAWNGNWEVKTAKGDGFWSCEMAIPFSELKVGTPRVGTTWGFNAARNQRTGGQVSEGDGDSNWAGVLGSAHQPKLFGDMVFSEEPIGVVSLSQGPMFYGSNPIKLEAYNFSSYTQMMGLHVDVGSGSDLKSRINQRLMLTKGERKMIDASYEIKDGDYLIVELRNDETGDVYQRERFPIALPAPRIAEVKARIAELDTAIRLAGDRNAHLSQQLKLAANGIRQKLDELQQTVDAHIRAKATLDPDRWKKIKDDLDGYSERIRSYGNILWTKSPWLTVMPGDLPDSTGGLDEITLTACVDEFESSVFQITNLLGSDYSGRLQLSDLVESANRSGGLRQIGKEHVVVRNVLYRNQRDGSVVPDALPRANEANELQIRSGQTTQVWLTIDSRDAAPGTYAGTITFKPFDRSLQTKTIKLNLTVLPIQLPAKMPIATYNWDYAGTEPYLRDLAEHRVNTFLLAAPLPELNANGELVKSGDYNSALLQLKRDYGQLMYSYGIIPSYDNYVKEKFQWQFMDEKWKKGFRAWIVDWMAKLKAIGIGYGDFSVQLWDEPKGDSVDKVVQAGAFLREIDPNIRTVMDPYTSTTAADIKKMAACVDIWIPVLPTLYKSFIGDADERVSFLKSTGKPVWAYTCETNMTGLSPVGYYRLKPWKVWDLGLSGCSFWAYNSWRGDSWDDFDTGGDTYSDNGAVYAGDYGPITSRRWEAYREGLEDYLYLHLLKLAVEKGKTARIDMNALLAAQEVLNKAAGEVLGSAQKDPAAIAAAEQDPAVLDATRDKIAKQILALNRLMPFTVKAPVTEAHDADVVIKWDTSEPCVGTVYYRKQGNQSWRAVTDLAPGSSHALTLAGLRSGMVYEFYTLSVNDIGLILVDDNKSAYYTCTR